MRQNILVFRQLSSNETYFDLLFAQIAITLMEYDQVRQSGKYLIFPFFTYWGGGFLAAMTHLNMTENLVKSVFSVEVELQYSKRLVDVSVYVSV